MSVLWKPIFSATSLLLSFFWWESNNNKLFLRRNWPCNDSQPLFTHSTFYSLNSIPSSKIHSKCIKIDKLLLTWGCFKSAKRIESMKPTSLLSFSLKFEHLKVTWHVSKFKYLLNGTISKNKLHLPSMILHSWKSQT